MGEKIEPSADRAALLDEMLRLRDMRGEAVELFAHIGLGRDHDRFLMQPVRIETLGLRKQCRNLLGKPRADGVGAPARRPLGASRERGDFAKPRRQDAAERSALMTAHLAERADRLGEAFDHRRLGAAPLLVALLGIADLDHAFEREQAVKRRRRRFHLRRDLPHRRQQRLKHRGIDAHHRRRAAAFDRQVGLNRSAAQRLGGARTYRPSIASQPGGRRSRRSRPLPLTDLISQAQA